MNDQILQFIIANPGSKNRAICDHVGKGPCDRDVDRVLQGLRKAKLAEYRPRPDAGWFALTPATQPSQAAMKLKEPTPSPMPPGGSPLLDQQPAEAWCYYCGHFESDHTSAGTCGAAADEHCTCPGFRVQALRDCPLNCGELIPDWAESHDGCEVAGLNAADAGILSALRELPEERRYVVLRLALTSQPSQGSKP